MLMIWCEWKTLNFVGYDATWDRLLLEKPSREEGLTPGNNTKGYQTRESVKITVGKIITPPGNENVSSDNWMRTNFQYVKKDPVSSLIDFYLRKRWSLNGR